MTTLMVRELDLIEQFKDLSLVCKAERAIQSFEYLLRACVLEKGVAWDYFLPLIEFTYNNDYHSSIGMTPFEDFHGRRCKTPLCWQKSYHDKRRKALEFREGDHVFLRITVVTGVGRTLKSKKLTPRFIGPYQISQHIGVIAYGVALLPSLSNLHAVFHVSQLRKYIPDPSHIIQMDDVQVQDNLIMEVLPVRIEDREVKQLRGKEIVLVKVVWRGPVGGNLT
ncbi:uncharacterized protein LOC127130634 [Lathyrus oleraceus]|uniref:uncharacterized protein LOC127130634 n=1 Tax=Pisum sativum TaxID=3888 RepID=UPI0021D0B4BA|nr:uncharacterized protein LOC127130634 [Pisum sativum]